MPTGQLCRERLSSRQSISIVTLLSLERANERDDERAVVARYTIAPSARISKTTLDKPKVGGTLGDALTLQRGGPIVRRGGGARFARLRVSSSDAGARSCGPWCATTIPDRAVHRALSCALSV